MARRKPHRPAVDQLLNDLSRVAPWARRSAQLLRNFPGIRAAAFFHPSFPLLMPRSILIRPLARSADW